MCTHDTESLGDTRSFRMQIVFSNRIKDRVICLLDEFGYSFTLRTPTVYMRRVINIYNPRALLKLILTAPSFSGQCREKTLAGGRLRFGF